MRENDLNEKDAPRCAKSKTEIDAPTRAKDLKDNDDPTFA
jgi:hypothetical protein